MRLALGISCLFLLAGCIPCSDAPLSQPGAQVPDAALMGMWTHTQGPETVTLHFGLAGDPRQITIVMTETDRAGKLDSSTMSALTTKAGDRNYLNIRFGDENAAEPGYLFVKYVVDGDTLGIAIIDSDAVSKGIQSGEIEGEVSAGEWASTIRIREAPGKLLVFLDGHDEELFPEMQYFHRVRQADAR